MAAQAKDYKLVDAYVVHNDTKYDIKALIAEFTWMETIDSPFVRCDMTLLDSIPVSYTHLTLPTNREV